MSREIEVWKFIAERLVKDGPVMFLVVAESSGSSPGRAGYKMAAGSDGQLCGSIGGGAMEVALVEQAKVILSEPRAATDCVMPHLIEQVHQKNSPNASGMICSGRQTVVIEQLSKGDLQMVDKIVDRLNRKEPAAFEISNLRVQIIENTHDGSPFYFSKTSETEFIYQERLGDKQNLYIIGGGHCALALSEVMSKMGFRIRIFDDRPELNTIEKNRFAHEISIIESYDKIAELVPSGDEVYVVVMTLGYASDELVIRQLIDKDLKYFGVLGSKAKMSVLLRSLREDGHRTEHIRTPIGLDINSRTPEEIAVSIAAEIISIKNAD